MRVQNLNSDTPIIDSGFRVYTEGRKPTPADIGALPSGSKAVDSNLLDGINSTSFLRSDATDTFTELNGSELNADRLGVSNTSSTSNKGLSLYGGASTGKPTYGIAFAGTAGMGQHGTVTSDWATYLTMCDTSTRGWIFQRGATNVASISGVGDAFFNGVVKGSALYEGGTALSGKYLGKTAKAADSNLLDGLDQSAFARIAGSTATTFNALSLNLKAGGSDHASINTTVSGTTTHLNFNLGDDVSGNDRFRFRFRPTGGTEYSLFEMYNNSSASDGLGIGKFKGAFDATSITENGTALSGKYLGITAKSSDSFKLEGKTKAQVIAEARSGYSTTSSANGLYMGKTAAYTKSESDGRFLGKTAKAADSEKVDGFTAGDISTYLPIKSASCVAGWVTVATSAGGRGFGEVYVWDNDSGDHAFMHLSFFRSYADSGFTVKNFGGHARRITGARVIGLSSDVTYGLRKLQVYVTTTSVYNVRIKDSKALSGYNNIVGVTPALENLPTGYRVFDSESTGLINTGGGTDTSGYVREKGDRVFSPNNRNISESTSSTSTSVYASSKAVKAAYDLAGTKITKGQGDGYYLGKTAKAADANLLDGINSTSFLRSDAADTMSQTLTLAKTSSSSNQLTLTNSSAGWNYIRYNSGGGGFDVAVNSEVQTGVHAAPAGALHFRPQGAKTNFYVADGEVGVNNVEMKIKGNKVWHGGNDGSGSGLDAGLLEGSNKASVIASARSGYSTTSAGDGRWLGKTDKAADSQLVDGVDSSRIIYGTNTSGCSPVSDFNSVIKSGFIENSGGAGTNRPGTGWVWGWNTDHTGSGAYGAQGVVAQDGHYYFRVKGSTGTGTWRKVMREDVADGKYLGKTAKAADSSLLEGSTKAEVIASARSGYLTTSGKAADAEKLDGINSTQFARTDIEEVFTKSVGVGNATPSGTFDNGKALAIGDSDTGLRQNGDGVLELWANNQNIATATTSTFKANKSLYEGANRVYSAANKPSPATLGALAVAGKAADSNKLDNLDSTQFLRSDANDTMNGNLQFAPGKSFYMNDSSNGGRVPAPGGGFYNQQDSAATGAIKIKLPVGSKAQSDMISFEVSIYDYAENESVKLLIAGYQYSAVNWNNQTVTTLTSNTGRDYKVRFGTDSTSHCVWIGELGSTWSYPKVQVSNFMGGHGSPASRYVEGWVISFVTAFDAVEDTITASLPAAQTATKLATARTISLTGDASGSTAFDGTGNKSITVVVNNDSHTHDGRYYTESESNGRYLGKTAKAADANLLDGINSSQFVRNDSNQSITGGFEYNARKLASGTDFNTLIRTATYNIYSASGMVNEPSGSDFGTLTVVGSNTVSGSFVTQMYINRGAGQEMWTRGRNDGAGAWTAWVRSYNTQYKPSKADVGLSNVPNYTITSSTTDSSNSKFATAGAVKAAMDNAKSKMTQATGDGRFLGKTAKAADAHKVDGYSVEQLFRRIDNTTDYKTTANIMTTQQFDNKLPVGLTGAYAYGGLMTINDANSRLRIYTPHQQGADKSAMYFATGWSTDVTPKWERVMTYTDAAGIYLTKTAKAGDSFKLEGSSKASVIASARSGYSSKAVADGLYLGKTAKAANSTKADYAHQVYVADTRGGQRAPSYYPDRYVSWDFQHKNDTLAGGDDWNCINTIAKWSSWNTAHRQEQVVYTGTGGVKHRYATSDTAWSAWKTFAFTTDKAPNSALLDGSTKASVISSARSGLATTSYAYSKAESANNYLGKTAKASTAGRADQCTVSNHDTNDTEYGPVWHNHSSSLYDSIAKYTFNPKFGRLSSTQFREGGTLLQDKYLGKTAKAADSNKLDNIDSSQFVRSDATDVKTAGHLTFNDNIYLKLGTGGNVEHFCNGSNYYTDINEGMMWYIRDGNSANATRYTFDVDGGHFVATGNITAYSDKRVKKNIEVITGALDKVSKLSGYTFDRTDIKTARQTGVIAQEVLEVLPEAVITNEDGKLSVAYGNMVGLLVEALKEEKSKREELESRLERLEKALGL